MNTRLPTIAVTANGTTTVLDAAVAAEPASTPPPTATDFKPARTPAVAAIPAIWLALCSTTSVPRRAANSWRFISPRYRLAASDSAPRATPDSAAMPALRPNRCTGLTARFPRPASCLSPAFPRLLSTEVEMSEDSTRIRPATRTLARATWSFGSRSVARDAEPALRALSFSTAFTTPAVLNLCWTPPANRPFMNRLAS